MPQRPSREEQLVQAVLQLAAPDECSAFLQGACFGDAALLQQCDALVRARKQSGKSLDPDLTVESAPTPERPLIEPLTEKPGDHIGHYKLLQQIGEGGMSIVRMPSTAQSRLNSSYILARG